MTNSSYTSSQFSWITVVSITFLQAINGTHSISSTYSSLIEHHYNMSQVRLNYLIVAFDTGRLFGWFSSTAAEYLPMWMILLIGLVLELVGFGVQYLHLIGKVSYLSYWHVLLLNVVAGTSICWINTYCNLVASRNFKDKTIISLTSSYSALGGKIYTLLVEGITGKRDSQNSSIYLLIRCVVPTVVGLAVALLLSCQKPIQFGEPDIYPAVFLIAIVTGAYALIESIAPPFKNMSPQLRIIILVLVIVLPFAVPPAINASSFTLKKWSSQVMPEVSTMDSSSNSQRVIEICCNGEKGGVIEKEQVEQAQEKNRDSSSNSQSIIEICCNEEKGGIIETEQIEQVQEKNRDVEVRDEHGVKDLLTSLDFWLFFWVNACGITLAMVYGNNLGRISQSRGNKEVSFLQVLSSLFGFFGRVFSVTFDWYTRERKLLSRSALIAIIMIPMPASFFLLTSDSSICLYISTSILGACSGAIAAIASSTTSELFGCQNASINQNIVLTSIPVGSLLFGHLAALNYDRERGSNYGECTGFNCHEKTFIIWGIICSMGTILSSVLRLRTQKFHTN
ncbi:unnamed protein product [Camellia sinensis]